MFVGQKLLKLEFLNFDFAENFLSFFLSLIVFFREFRIIFGNVTAVSDLRCFQTMPNFCVCVFSKPSAVVFQESLRKQ